MRILAVLVVVLSLLATSIQAMQIAGDIGPGKNGAVLIVRVAGDIGPGKNG